MDFTGERVFHRSLCLPRIPRSRAFTTATIFVKLKKGFSEQKKAFNFCPVFLKVLTEELKSSRLILQQISLAKYDFK